MQALVVNDGKLIYEAERTFQPRPGEIAVRVLQAGVCETDLQILKGYMGFAGVLGHEFVGVAQSGRYAGQRVVGEINCGCGQCEFCCQDLSRHCPHRTVLGIVGRDGAFAQWLSLPEQNLLPIPDALPDDVAVFVEPVAAAFEILEQCPAIAGRPVVILGDGRLGNVCAQVLAAQDCEVTVVGKHAHKLELLENCGLKTLLVPASPPAQSAEYVVDCTGSSTGFEQAVSLLRPRGTLILKTTVAGQHTVSLAPLVIHEITLIGSRCGRFEPAIQALVAGQVSVKPLIEKTVPLPNAVEAIEAAIAHSSLKVLITMP